MPGSLLLSRPGAGRPLPAAPAGPVAAARARAATSACPSAAPGPSPRCPRPLRGVPASARPTGLQGLARASSASAARPPPRRRLVAAPAGRSGAGGSRAESADEEDDGYADDGAPPLSERERARLDAEAAELAASEFGGGDGPTGLGLEDVNEELEEDAADEDVASGDLTKAQRMTRSQRRRALNSHLWTVPEVQLARVAIVGRPNVGKSALFNRLTDGAGRAIVYDEAGVTRDRRYSRAIWNGREFLAIDTGGLTELTGEEGGGGGRYGSGGGASGGGTAGRGGAAAVSSRAPAVPDARADFRGVLRGLIERQAALALEEAHLALVVVDGQSGPAASDEALVRWLRRHHPKLPVVLAVNKCESPVKGASQAAEFWGLGLEPRPVSALSGTGTGDLLDALVAALPAQEALARMAADRAPPPPEEDEILSVAIVGRPNVGKSSLLNALSGQERSCVSDTAGTTMDDVDSLVVGPGGNLIRLVDTAGIRKRGAVAAGKDGVEDASVRRAFQALRRADVAALVLDAAQGATEQDVRLADRISAEGTACVLVVNKWDTVPDKDGQTMTAYERTLKYKLKEVDWAQAVYTCASTGQRVPKILAAVAAAGEQHRKRVTTALLNQVVRDAVGFKPPPANGVRKGRIYYATQAAVRPPTFVFFVNDPRLFSEAYRRYIERMLRENVGFPGTPLRLLWRGKAPAAPRGSRPKPASGAPNSDVDGGQPV